MPLDELYRLAKGKLDSNETNNTCGTDRSSIPENDLVELVWGNGPISMQGQSSRARKSPTCRSVPSHCLPSHSPKNKDKGVGYGANTRIGKFWDLDSGLNDISMPLTSGEVDLSQDEEMISWLNCTIDDTLPREYSSDFLHKLSDVTVNELPASSNCALMGGRSNYNQVFRDSNRDSVRDVSSSEHGNFNKGSSAGETETTRPKTSTSLLYLPSSQQCQTSFASFRSGVSDITENNTSNLPREATCEEISLIQSGLKMQKQDPGVPGNSSTILNFSHFARPAAIMRANLQSIANTNKDAAATSSNPSASTSGECLKESTKHCQQVVEPSKADLKPLESKTLEQNVAAFEQSDPVAREGAMKDNQTFNQVLGGSVTRGQTVGERSLEPAVAPSSVCSGNGVERTSDDPNQNFKRKTRDTEDSEWYSEDVEEESVGVKRAAHTRGVIGSKRSRSAEVHNLSERRRRDRINEKMRALQELIPNCNKVDKASMLDEAIEYLKTLQLQVQIMSMGAGLYMPPMMLPPGMQHLRAQHMAPFSPMGIGMQMGLGMAYGMGMPEMNGSSSRFPMIQVAQMQGAHFPVSPMPGHNALHGMTRPNTVFGFPGQGHPLQIPRASTLPLPGGPIMNSSALGSNASGAVGLMQTVASASASGLQDPMLNVNSQIMQSTTGSNSASQMSTQCEARDVGPEQSALVHDSGHASDVNGTTAVNPDKEDNLVTDGLTVVSETEYNFSKMKSLN